MMRRTRFESEMPIDCDGGAITVLHVNHLREIIGVIGFFPDLN